MVFQVTPCYSMLFTCLSNSQCITEMCAGHEDVCGNVGTCVGSRTCLCPKGTVGEKCDTAGG